jgi:hypothetical protein
MQYYTKEAVVCMQLEGGNLLPLKVDKAPYVSVLLPTAWLDEKDEEFVFGTARKFMDVAIEEAKRKGSFVDYVYMNYGSCYQDVLKS